MNIDSLGTGVAQSVTTDHQKKRKPTVQPINYSLILNLATLGVCGFLAYVFSQPLLIVLAIVLQSHALERFRDAEQQRPHLEDEDESQPMGFLADVK